MGSIDHQYLEHQSCVCRWHFDSPRHHDVWLMKLQRLNEHDRRSFVRENEEQARCVVLPDEIIPLIDIHDFAIEHADRLTAHALAFALKIRYLARDQVTQRRFLQLEDTLVESSNGG